MLSLESGAHFEISKFRLRAKQIVALAGVWGHFFTESAPIPSESIIAIVALARVWRALRSRRFNIFLLRLCVFFKFLLSLEPGALFGSMPWVIL